MENYLEIISKDILYEILFKINLDDIINLCITNKNLNEKICENQEFWNGKLNREFSKSLKYLENENPKDFYRLLLEIHNMEYMTGDAIRDNNLKILKYMDEMEIDIPSQHDIYYAMELNKIEILQWIREKNFDLPIEYALINAIRNKNMKILKWLNENNLIVINDNIIIELENKILINNDHNIFDSDILDFFVKNNLYTPNQNTANFMAFHGNLKFLKWMKKNNLPLPNQEGANNAASNGHLDILEWLKENNLPLPDQNGANMVAENGHLKILEFLKRLNREQLNHNAIQSSTRNTVNNLPLPNQTGANLAAKHGQLYILNWLKINNLPLSDQDGANLAAKHGQLHILNWLKINNLPLPDQDGSNDAHDTDILKFIKENNLPLPNKQGLITFIMYGREDNIRWILNQMKKSNIEFPTITNRELSNLRIDNQKIKKWKQILKNFK